MNAAPMKTVALADTRWAGHHQTYLFELSASLLRNGVRLILLCPHPEKIRERLLAAGLDADEERLRGVTLIASNRSYFSKRDHDPLTTLMRWQRTGQRLRECEAEHGWRPDLVFFAYLDNYVRFMPFHAIPEILLGYPWTGIYFRNHHLGEQPCSLTLAAKGDYLFRSESCQAICVLDERFSGALQQLSGKRIIEFPDVTDEVPPAAELPEVTAIVKQAAGRKIVCLISMERRKGVLTLLKAAREAKLRGLPYFFVATGTFMSDTFTPEQLAFCKEVEKEAKEGRLDNLIFHTDGGRVSDEFFNGLFMAADVIWAGYEDFEGSSNALTKAALWKAPVLATAGQCVGARVERYRLGATFPERDVDKCLAALKSILEESPEERATRDFAGYHAQHSRARLDSLMGGLVEDINRQP